MEKRAEARKMAIDALKNAPPVLFFRQPLDYIVADHFRQRTLCRVLDEIAVDVKPDVPKIDVALSFITNELGPHVQDEEEDLFPLLRRRAHPEDEINLVLGKLSQEHSADQVDGDEIIAGLPQIKAQPDYCVQNPFFAQLLKRFAANERQHLIVENAIVLPLARVRLTEADLNDLGRRMAARRGIPFPEPVDAN